jgi:hypothetical protein
MSELCSCGHCGFCGGSGRLRVTYMGAYAMINGDDGSMSCPHCETGRRDAHARGSGDQHDQAQRHQEDWDQFMKTEAGRKSGKAGSNKEKSC